MNADKPFMAIENVNRQAEAWATCAATYDIAAEIFETSDPANSQQLSNFAKGAELAIAMSTLNDSIQSEPSPNPEKFTATWSYAKVLMVELPKSRRTLILADVETLGVDGHKTFLSRLGATLKVCTTNLQAPQAYVESWRELAKSGLLKFLSN